MIGRFLGPKVVLNRHIQRPFREFSANDLLEEQAKEGELGAALTCKHLHPLTCGSCFLGCLQGCVILNRREKMSSTKKAIV